MIWMVESGLYENVVTHGVFLSAKGAIAAVAMHEDVGGHGGYRIKRFRVGEWGSDAYDVRQWYSVTLSEEAERGCVDALMCRRKSIVNQRAEWDILGKAGQVYIRVKCVADSVADARRIAKDIRQRVLGHHGWVIGRSGYAEDK